jgi:hypothetical protein
MTNILYKASPTLARFHNSNAMVRGIVGPIGSGKSVACCNEILMRAMNQAPSTDGIRRTRWAIIRNTYGELKSTTIKTWQEWIPDQACKLVYDAPIRGVMKKALPDGTTMEMEVNFIALDKPKDVKKLLSLELTGAFINEARELPFDVITNSLSRTGRYPSKRTTPAGITWTGIIMDTNPPDTDHWWYKIAELGDEEMTNSSFEGLEEKALAGVDYSWQFFRQPGALIQETDRTGKVTGYRANPDAENVEHHQEGYYYWMKNARGWTDEQMKVMCCGQYGSSFDGKPVYHNVYNDTFHASQTPLGVFRKMPLLLAWDFGLTPACVIGQETPTGQLRILREYICERGGVKQFAQDVVKPALNSLFPGMVIISVGDPAGEQPGQADEYTPIQALCDVGIYTRPARSNSFQIRRQAVIDRLSRIIDGEPAILIDPSCDMIRRGFIGGYRFKRVLISGETDRYRDEPDKNKFSHIADAVQYMCLGSDYVEPSPSTTIHAPPPKSKFKGFV